MKSLKYSLLLILFLSAISYAQNNTSIKLKTDEPTSFTVERRDGEIMMSNTMNDGGFYLLGTYGTGLIPIEGAGTRLMWFPGKAAFRAGRVDYDHWNLSNIGEYSFSWGFNTIAKSFNSIVLGRYNVGGGTSNLWIPTEPIFEIGIGTGEFNRANAVTVLKDGKVGIGTAVPQAKLDVTGNIAVNGNAVIDATGKWVGEASGLVGPEGPQGPQGVKGDKGDQGIQGVQGEVGPQGVKGDKGDTGAEGPQGIQGEQGLKGDKGDQGIQGVQGEVGPQGEKGDKGDQGVQGIQGPIGLTGLQGPQGIPGDKGDKGDTGATGPQGEAGPQGVAGEQGIQGEKGDKGDQGVQGIQGPIGLTGVQGPQGIQGDKGDKGETGAVGPQGEKGDKGDQGIQGIQGEAGPTGPQGLQGEKGDKGDIGATGAVGPQGIQGEQGLKGDKGDTGAVGPQGPQGEKGDTGASPFTLTGNNATYTQGNVGIGTTTPTQKLDVNGTVQALRFIGSGSSATSDFSTAIGNNSVASGFNSTAIGIYTRAESYASFVIGQLNVGGGSPTSWPYTDPLFEIGNGDWGTGTRSNAVTVLKNGNTGIGLGAAKPTEMLEVGGTVKATAFVGDGSQLSNLPTPPSIWQQPSANQIYYNMGNVGINQANPTATLEVGGTVKATSFVGDGTGLTGIIGQPGPAGPQGPQGEKGDQGVQGIQGPIGLTGVQGPQGIPGDKGDKGETGAVGPQGEQGIQGVAGPQGLDGKTAFELAQLNGFAGTEAEWIASLKGEKGDKGDTGATGAQGEVGPAGPQGPQGEKGDKGDTGEQGPAGASPFALNGAVADLNINHPGYTDVRVTNDDNTTQGIARARFVVGTKSTDKGYLEYIPDWYTMGESVFYTSNASYMGIWQNSINPFGIWTNGSERLRVDGNGNVGIGTTTPTEKLDVAGTVKATAFIGDGSLLTNLPAGTETDPQVGSNTTNYLSKWDGTALVTSSVIDNNGNVGIGTTTPTDLIQVHKNQNGKTDIKVSNNDITANDAGSRFVVGTSSSDQAYFEYINNWTYYGINQASALLTSNVPYLGLFQFGANPIGFWTNSGERMRISGTGNVGIGTSNPVSRLVVKSPQANIGVMYITPSSNNSNALFSFTNNGAAGDALLQMGKNSEAGSYVYNQVTLNTNGDSWLNGGNVGIGTTAPTEKLDVAGTVKADRFVGTAPGQVLNIVMNNYASDNTSVTVGSATHQVIASITYTPVSSSSKLIIEFNTPYTINGYGVDSFSSSVEVAGTQVAYGFQQYTNASGGSGTRSGTIFPLMGAYINSSTSSKIINVFVWRNSGDDSFNFTRDMSTWIKITEIAR